MSRWHLGCTEVIVKALDAQRFGRMSLLVKYFEKFYVKCFSEMELEDSDDGRHSSPEWLPVRFLSSVAPE
ncbi:hypothetical protein GCM10022223_55210 [Kineosporia mesophila]|uniref:Uncharacterized protein n=1 Tax=Kineosporia mesophila TaxID=566012 RepID=A0ABP7AEF0_9ACTN